MYVGINHFKIKSGTKSGVAKKWDTTTITIKIYYGTWMDFGCRMFLQAV